MSAFGRIADIGLKRLIHYASSRSSRHVTQSATCHASYSHPTCSLNRTSACAPVESSARCPLMAQSGHGNCVRRCLLSGNSGHWACLLYPQKRTSELGRGMSALCQSGHCYWLSLHVFIRFEQAILACLQRGRDLLPRSPLTVVGLLDARGFR